MGRSSNVSAQQCINYFYDPTPKGEQNEGALVATPGGTVFADLLVSGENRGGYNYRNIAYYVIGNRFYELTEGGQLLQRGATLTTDGGRVGMAANASDQLMIDDGSKGYIYDPTVKTLTEITDQDFIASGIVVHQDGYFISINPNTNQFQLSDLNNGLSWQALSTQSAEGHPDYLVSILSDRRELWLFGEETTEVWYNQGDANNPFARFQNGYVETGIAAAHSVAKHDNSVVWLAKNDRGQAMVVRAADGFQPAIISPPELNYQFQQYGRIDDAFAYAYQMEGHEFYVLNFPSAGATWAYDALTKEWAQRAHTVDEVFPNRERYNSYLQAYGKHLLGDYINGKIYAFDSNTYTIDSTVVPRVRSSAAVTTEDEDQFSIHDFQLHMEEGVGLSDEAGGTRVWLSYSKDGGHTWSNERQKNIGATGQYDHRIIWRKLGRGRNWIFRVRTWSTRKTIIKGATVKTSGEGYGA